MLSQKYNGSEFIKSIFLWIASSPFGEMVILLLCKKRLESKIGVIQAFFYAERQFWGRSVRLNVCFTEKVTDRLWPTAAFFLARQEEALRLAGETMRLSERPRHVPVAG